MKNLRTEQEILQSWKINYTKPVVSVCCITFNHENYIEDAIEGFLIQETDFPFEIIIHDDASSDSTARIIEDYATRYPNIIRVILQTENQFSKNFHLPFWNVVSKSCGEYIAICEGDDYWTSKDKLNLQLKHMSLHPQIEISFHPAYQDDGNKSKKNIVVSNYGNKIKKFETKDVILGDGGFMPTQSLLFKADVIERLPKWYFESAPVGDYYLQIIAAHANGALYLPFVFSSYRINVSGSWSSMQQSRNKRMTLLAAHFNALLELNDYSQNNYDLEIRKVFSKYLFVTSIKNNLTIRQFLELRTVYKRLILNGGMFSFVLNGLIMVLRNMNLKYLKTGFNKN